MVHAQPGQAQFPNFQPHQRHIEFVRLERVLHPLDDGVVGYHRQSRAETKMHCLKLLGQRLSARDFDRQVAEFQVRLAVLNGFTSLGTPITEVAG